MDFGSATWTEIAEAPIDVLLIPLGATEQHGPHLPLDTDTRIASAVAQLAAAEADCAVAVAPTLPFGASGEHAGFAGTLSIGHGALRNLLVELVRSIETPTRIIFVNGHGGNHDGVRAATRDLELEGRPTTCWWPQIAGGDAHAGHTETSLMLAIEPDLVRLDHLEPGASAPLDQLMSTLRERGVRAVAPNGILGDPTRASVAEGHALLRALVTDLVALIDTIRPSAAPTRNETGSIRPSE